MEESAMALVPTEGTLEELALEGQKHLEAVVNAAHQMLASLDEALCDPATWTASATAPTPAAAAVAASNEAGVPGSGPGSEPAVEAARTQYKAATAALRAVIVNIFASPQMQEADGDDGGVKADPAELEQLEYRAQELREEVVRKNRVVKALIDKTREMTSCLSMWQTIGM